MVSRRQWSTLLLFSLVLALLQRHHVFWRDEVQAWQFAVHASSISFLFRHLRYEGHPALWFLLLRGLNAIFHSPHVLPAAHWLLASLNTFLILRYCPIPAWQRVACCFGYFMTFEFGVISRGYALELFVAFLFVVVQSRYPRATIGPALLIAVLMHTEISGALLAISLLAYWCLRMWRESGDAARRLPAAIAIAGVSGAALVWCLNPPADGFFTNSYRAYRHQLTIRDALWNTRLFWRVIVPVPRLDALHFWNTNLADSIPPNVHSHQVLVAALLLTLAVTAFIHRFEVMVLLVVGTILLAGFSTIHGQTYMRHQGQWFVLLFICFWIDRAHGDQGIRDFGGMQRKLRRIFPAVVIAIQPIALLVVLGLSHKAPFSSADALMTAVMEKQASVSAFDGFAAWPERHIAQVSFASGRPAYSPQQDDLESFSFWQDHTMADPEYGAIEASLHLAARVRNSPSPLIFCTDNQTGFRILRRLPADVVVTRLVEVPDGIVDLEMNAAFVLQKAR